MLKLSMLVLVAVVVGACATTPMSSEEVEQGVIQSTALEACFQKGWIQHPEASAAYLAYIQSSLSSRGDPAQIAQYRKKAQAAVPQLTVGVCRKVEIYSLQYVQKVAKQEQDMRELNASLDGLYGAADQIRASTPTTTMCQRAGMMVACNSF